MGVMVARTVPPAAVITAAVIIAVVRGGMVGTAVWGPPVVGFVGPTDTAADGQEKDGRQCENQRRDARPLRAAVAADAMRHTALLSVFCRERPSKRYPGPHYAGSCNQIEMKCSPAGRCS